MSQAVITWTPPAGAQNQMVQYKFWWASTWTTFSTVAGDIDTETITGLSTNILYNYRVVSNCGGNQVVSPVFEAIKFECPEVVPTTKGIAGRNVIAVTASFDKITVDLFWLPSDVNKIQVQLLADDDTVKDTRTIIPLLTGTSFTQVYPGLGAETTYKVRVILFAGAGFIYSQTCSSITVITTKAPVAGKPAHLIVKMNS